MVEEVNKPGSILCLSIINLPLLFRLHGDLQRWWRSWLLSQSGVDSSVEEVAVVCLQSAWRGYRERRRFLQQRASAVTIQRNWRSCRRRHCTQAAVVIQTAWRRVRERNRFRRARSSVTQLQAVGRGYLARVRWVEIWMSLR